jgi:BlaI family transcriptional regulator, penicillinase repressor
MRVPTDGELAILKVLWRIQAGTVRQVHDAIDNPTAYTTTLKLLQIMHDKGLVERDTSKRSHVYRPRLAEADAQRSLLSELTAKAFDGSASALVMRALSSAPTSPDELAAIRAMLDDLDEGDA